MKPLYLIKGICYNYKDISDFVAKYIGFDGGSMDIFISYRRNTGAVKAHLIESKLKERGIKCFLDVQGIHNENFWDKIMQQIDACPNFLMIVTPDYFTKREFTGTDNEKDWVFEEIDYAIKKRKTIIGICFEEDNGIITIPKEFPELQNRQIFTYSLTFESASISKIIDEMTNHSSERFSLEKDLADNDWYAVHEMSDDDWLWIIADQKICYNFDAGIFRRIAEEDIFRDKDELNICIYQCRHVELYYRKYQEAFKDCGKKINYFGICYDIQQEEADSLFGPGHFISAGLCEMTENKGRQDALMRLLKNNGLEGFDMIDFTLYLKDLKYPQRRLEESTDLLNPDGGIVYIRDLDDNLVLAYPDERKEFTRILEYLDMDDGSGNRAYGRTINRTLRFAGAKKIYISEEGVSTVAFSRPRERAEIFDAYLSYLKPELYAMAEEHPESEEYRGAAYWFESNYERIRDRFKSEEFYFKTGYIAGYGVFNI